jgi:hypothetical protein
MDIVSTATFTDIKNPLSLPCDHSTFTSSSPHLSDHRKDFQLLSLPTYYRQPWLSSGDPVPQCTQPISAMRPSTMPPRSHVSPSLPVAIPGHHETAPSSTVPEPIPTNQSCPHFHHLRRVVRSPEEAIVFPTAQPVSSNFMNKILPIQRNDAATQLLHNSCRGVVLVEGVLYTPGMEPVRANMQIEGYHDPSIFALTAQQSSCIAPETVHLVPAGERAIRRSSQTSSVSRRADPLLHHPLRMHPLPRRVPPLSA